jgi:hypothetical protein
VQAEHLVAPPEAAGLGLEFPAADVGEFADLAEDFRVLPQPVARLDRRGDVLVNPD